MPHIAGKDGSIINLNQATKHFIFLVRTMLIVRENRVQQMKIKKLSQKRIKFIHEYLQCWNSSEAARRAGYSEKTAHSAGSFLLSIPEVLAKIEEIQEQNAMNAAEVIARLTAHARGSMAHFVQVSSNKML